MLKILIAAALAAVAARPVAASDKGDVLSVLHKWVEAFNNGGDMKPLAMSSCADPATLLGNLPPYEWHGEGACSRWLADFATYAKTNEMTNVSATLGRVREIDVNGDRAYVVAPVTFTYKVKGKPTRETGGWTVALQKAATGWQINAWAYSLYKREVTAVVNPPR
jgi:hypothetical protein